MAVGGLHPEAFEFVIQNFDVLEPLHPRVAGPTGRNQAQGEAVLPRQRLAIQFVGKQRVRVQSLGYCYGALESRHFTEWDIGAIEQELGCAGFQSRFVKNVAQAHASPAAASNGAEAPLGPRHARRVEAATITGALENTDEFGTRHLLEIVESQDDGLFYDAVDAELPIGEFDLRNVSVAANEEVFDRRNFVDEGVHGHLEIQRLRRERDHFCSSGLGGFGDERGCETREKYLATRERHS